MPEVRPTVISLTTDFGNADHYVGALKASILSVSAQIPIVDITNDIPAHNVMEAGWALRNAYATFPRLTVHLAVVDPGVGTARRPIAAVSENYYFVGPDNGIFSFVFDAEPPARVYEIRATHFMRSPVSPTFHARDIFGPVAAHLACRADVSNVGDPIEDFVRLDLPRPTVTKSGSVQATVAHVDRFGNVVLNLTRPVMEGFMERMKASGFTASAGSTQVAQRFSTYGEAPRGTPFLLFNSSGFLEIAANQARASDILKLRAGDSVELSLSVP